MSKLLLKLLARHVLIDRVIWWSCSLTHCLISYINPRFEHILMQLGSSRGGGEHEVSLLTFLSQDARDWNHWECSLIGLLHSESWDPGNHRRFLATLELRTKGSDDCLVMEKGKNAWLWASVSYCNEGLIGAAWVCMYPLLLAFKCSTESNQQPLLLKVTNW